MFERLKTFASRFSNALFRGLELVIPGLGQLTSGHTIKGLLLFVFITVPLSFWSLYFFTNCLRPVFPAFGAIEEHLAHHRMVVLRYFLVLIPFAAGWIYNFVDILSGKGREEPAAAARARAGRTLNIPG